MHLPITILRLYIIQNDHTISFHFFIHVSCFLRDRSVVFWPKFGRKSEIVVHHPEKKLVFVHCFEPNNAWSCVTKTNKTHSDIFGLKEKTNKQQHLHPFTWDIIPWIFKLILYGRTFHHDHFNAVLCVYYYFYLSNKRHAHMMEKN